MATDFLTNNFSDNFRFVRSKRLVAPADGTYNLIRIPKYAFVVEVWLEKITAYASASATVSVGFVGNGESPDAVGFLNTTLGDADAVEVVRASADAEAASQGKYFDAASGFITLTSANDSNTSGDVWIFALYSIVH